MSSLKKPSIHGIKISKNNCENILIHNNFDLTSNNGVFINWVNTDMSGLNLQNVVLSGQKFCGADLSGVNLRDAKLSRCDFREANLKGADLQGADLSSAIFDSTNLTDVNMWGARLSNTRFYNIISPEPQQLNSIEHRYHDFAYQSQRSGDSQSIVALDLTLNQKMMDPKAKKITVTADVLTIKDTIILNGMNIEIRARKVVCVGDQAMVEVSEKQISPYVKAPMDPSQAASGSSCGRDGVHGKKGERGQKGNNGGNIFLFAGEITGKLQLLNSGGLGQFGQEGQRGGNGSGGCDGKDYDPQFTNQDGNRTYTDSYGNQRPLLIYTNPGEDGGRGGNGGNGGDGGDGGNGGDGGKIVIRSRAPVLLFDIYDLKYMPPSRMKNPQHLFEDLDIGQIEITSFPGDNGFPGAAGYGGSNGDGGAPGLGAEYDNFNGDAIHEHRKKIGPVGALGEPGSKGQLGENGKRWQGDYDACRWASTSNYPNLMSEKGWSLSSDPNVMSQYLLTMHRADLAYLAKEYSSARILYQWIVDIIYPVLDLTQMTSYDWYNSLYSKASALLNQLDRGLDFYADSVNHVPFASLKLYQSQLDGILLLGKDIEDTLDNYQTLEKDHQQARKVFNKHINNAHKFVKGQKEHLDQLNGEAAQLMALIPLVDKGKLHFQAQLAYADKNFTDAVASKGKGCSFEKTLKITEAIVSVGADVVEAYESVGNIGKAFKDIKSVGKLFESGKKIVKEIKSVKGNIDDIQKQWEVISPINQKTPDAAKLIMKEKDFNDAIKPYLDMPEAEKYRVLVHDYIGIVQSLNCKLLEYSNTIIEIYKVQAIIKQKELAITEWRSEEAENFDPSIIKYKAFLLTLYQDMKSTALKYLYHENQAYNYWSLSENKLDISDNKMADLDAIHGEIKEKMLEFTGAEHSVGDDLNKVISIFDDGTEENNARFSMLRKERLFYFQIPTDHPAFFGWSEIKITHLKVLVYEQGKLPNNQNLHVELEHNGRGTIVSRNGSRHLFSHNSVSGAYDYNINSKGEFHEGSQGTLSDASHIGLTPFTTWRIKLENSDINNIDINKVDRFELTFIGKAVDKAG